MEEKKYTLHLSKKFNTTGARGYLLTIPADAYTNKEELEEALSMEPCKSCFILHDKDTVSYQDISKYPELDLKLNEPKFAHYHVILDYGKSKQSKPVMKVVAESLHAVYLDRMQNPLHSYDYLTHKKYIHKYQYPETDIVFVNGFEPPEEETPTLPDAEIKKILRKEIKQNNVLDFSDLVDLAEDSYPEEVSRYLMRYDNFYYKYMAGLKRKVDDCKLYETVQTNEHIFDIENRLSAMDTEISLLKGELIIDELTGEIIPSEDVMLGA